MLMAIGGEEKLQGGLSMPKPRRNKPMQRPSRVCYEIKGAEYHGIEFDSKCQGSDDCARFFWVPPTDQLFRWVLKDLGRFALVNNTLSEKRKKKLVEESRPPVPIAKV
jgi:hypothetical protein